jgi:diguanylate cyclase (GGDEF)-like protein/PAS domain S-box-containing protein
MGMARDIHEVLEALRRSEERLSLHVRQTPLGVIEWDLHFRAVEWNPAAERIFGYTREEAIGRSGVDLIVPQTARSQVHEIWKAILERRGGERSTNENITRDGRAIFCEWYNTPLVDHTGRVIGVASLVQDITSLRRQQTALEASEARFRGVVEGLQEGILITDPDDTIVYVNGRMAAMTGHAPAQMVGQPAHLLLLPRVPRKRTTQRVRDRLHGVVGCYEIELRRRDGSTFWAQINAGPHFDAAHRIIGTLGAVTDISERRRAEEALRSSEERFRLLTENALDIITIVAPDGTIQYESVSVERVLGFRPEERIGANALHAIHPDDLTAVRRELSARSCRNSVASDPIVYRMRHRNGGWRWLESVGNNLLGHPAVNGILINTRDVTERREAEDRMRWQALHDPLTGLPNRLLFHDRLAQALVTAQRRNEKAAVLFLDLDRFKHINDSLGHEVGDRVLQEVGTRLADCLPNGATIARMGGDEFTILLPRIGASAEAAHLAQTMLECLHPPFTFDHLELYIGGSIGIAVFPTDGADAQTLLKHADVAMYRAKEQRVGGMQGSYQRYTAAMDAQAYDHLMLQNRLRKAVSQGEFALWYQPQIDARTGRLVGMEALVRWEHPDFGLLEPERFIPVAEETGLVVPLGEWVIRAACEQAVAWREAGRDDVTVAVNLSAWHFRRPGFAAFFRDVLERTGLEGARLNLELTETVLMEKKDLTVETLAELKTLGIRLSVDDFGTGYSSLAYLRQFPLDILKIDRAFVRDIASNPADRAVIKALIELAHALELSVIAEGVETEEQIRWLKDLGCDVLQGYRLGRPLPAEHLKGIIG